MRTRETEKAIIIPAGLGMNPSTSPELLDPTREVALVTNLDTRYPRRWTKRLPIIRQEITVNGDSFSNNALLLFYLKKADSTYYDIIVDASGRLLVQWFNTSGIAQGYDIVDATFQTAYSTTGILPRGVQYRDKFLTFNGYDKMKYFLEGESGTYNSDDYGIAGVGQPDYRPTTEAYNTSVISYEDYDETRGGILGGPGNGLVQYKEIFEYEDGYLYGNPGGGGYHQHPIDTFDGGNGYGNPFVEFQWFIRYQLERVSGVYDVESADSSLVTARVLGYRYKYYADEPFSEWQRSANRNIGDMSSAAEADWTDGAARTGVEAGLNNDEPSIFKYGCIVGGKNGVMVSLNRQKKRTIPYPIVKTAKWGTPTHRNKITIQNNGARTSSRPTLIITIDGNNLSTSGDIRDITTDYDDIVFTASDGLTIWDANLYDFSTIATAFGDASTQFDITNPSGNTFRYTYDGTGASPLFVDNGAEVGDSMVINGENFNAANNVVATLTAVTNTYIEITNASGVVESNKTIGTGSIKLNKRAFIVTPEELISGQTLIGYIYYREDATGTAWYGAWNNVYHPPFVESDQIFLSWCDEEVWPPLTGGSDSTGTIRNKADSIDGPFGDSDLWVSTDSRPYGLNDTQDIDSQDRPQLGRTNYIQIMRDGDHGEGNDAIGHFMDTATLELWFKQDGTAIVDNTYYKIAGYTYDNAADNRLLIYYYYDNGGGVAPGGIGEHIVIDIGTERRWLELQRVSDVQNAEWTYLGLTFSSTTFYCVCVPIYSTTESLNWSNIAYETTDGAGTPNSTFTSPAYEYSATDYWYIGKAPIPGSGVDAVQCLAFYVGEVRLTERFMAQRELFDRACDWTFHGGTSLTDPTDQADISISIDALADAEDISDTSDIDETEVNWSKVDGEVFPLEQVAYLPEAGTGIIEWQGDVIPYCENSIHRIVTSNRPEEWEFLRNIAQEASGIGCIAPGSLIKTEDAMIFFSARGLMAFDGENSPINISVQMWRYWLDTYGLDAIKEAVCFYWPREEQIFVSIPSSSGGNIDNTYVFDWGEFIRPQAGERRTLWAKYEHKHDSSTDYGARNWILKDGESDSQDAYFSAGFTTNPTIFKIEKGIYVGDHTTQFDITNPSGNTMRYTYDDTGTNPQFASILSVGDSMVINSTNFNANNNGTFTLTAGGVKWLEVTNASGVVESNKTLGRDDAMKVTTNDAIYKDMDEDGDFEAIEWDLHTAEILTDNADVTQLDFRITQRTPDATDRDQAALDIDIFREGSSAETKSDYEISMRDSYKPAPLVRDTVQLRLSEDSSNDATDQTRINKIELAIQPR